MSGGTRFVATPSDLTIRIGFEGVKPNAVPSLGALWVPR